MTMGQVCCERIHDLCDERKISLNKLSIMCGMTQAEARIQPFPRSKKSVTVWISRLWNFLIQTYSKIWIRKLNKLFVSLKKTVMGTIHAIP